MESPDSQATPTGPRDRAAVMRAIRERREAQYGPDRNEAQLPHEVVAEALALQAQFAEGARKAS